MGHIWRQIGVIGNNNTNHQHINNIIIKNAASPEHGHDLEHKFEVPSQDPEKAVRFPDKLFRIQWAGGDPGDNSPRMLRHGIGRPSFYLRSWWACSCSTMTLSIAIFLYPMWRILWGPGAGSARNGAICISMTLRGRNSPDSKRNSRPHK